MLVNVSSQSTSLKHPPRGFHCTSNSFVSPNCYRARCAYAYETISICFSYAYFPSRTSSWPADSSLLTSHFSTLWEHVGSRCDVSLCQVLSNYFKEIEAYMKNVKIIFLSKMSLALLDVSKEVGLEVNPEKTKYMLLWQRHSIKMANRSFEDVAEFKCLGTTLTDQNCIHEEIKSRLNSGSACYHSVQSLLSSRLLSRNVKVKIYKSTIPPVILYGCETWSVTRGVWEQGSEKNIWT
jgi:hypothetical protein